MNRELRRRVEALFDAVLDLSDENREAALLRAEPEIAMEVRALLAANEIADEVFPLPEPATRNLRVGAYELVREIGRGGMGVVYLAERADGQYHQRVAIKLIGTAAVDDPLHQRFLAERQILAGLDHPNIARLLDGGVTDDQRPYLVLEYVDGMPITDYCEAHRLGIDERLRLFIEVCEAVQHAHRKLIIHRDLKPGNILVTETGQVRLLDFGIAKLLDPGSTGAFTPETRADFRLMTPGYASPEQVRGDLLTTASDIYSLGVLLYELLTGSSPYPDTAASAAEMMELICSRDPERPSVRVSRTASTGSGGLPTSSGTRWRRQGMKKSGPERLRHELRGDLDSIVMMAMRKEPGHRYVSCDHLREDIERYLTDRPVLAHQGNRRYLATRFLRRHRIESFAAVLVLLSLLTGIGVATRQAALASRAQSRAESERAAAQEVASFLEGLFEAVDPYAPASMSLDTLSVRGLLARGAARIRTELSTQPLVQAQLLDVVGRVHQNLGLFDDASHFLVDALQLRREVLGSQHPDVAASLQHLGELLTQTGDLPAAQRALEEALAINRQGRSADDPEIALGLNALANVFRELGRYAEATELHLEAIDRFSRDAGEETPTETRFLADLVRTLESGGEHDLAEHYARESISLARRVFGDLHPETAMAQRELGLLLQRRSAYAEAESLFRQALGSALGSLGYEHPRVADLLSRLASVRRWQNDFTAADSLHRESIELKRRLYGDIHIEIAYSLNNYATVLRRLGDHTGADSLHLEAIAVSRAIVGDDHATYWIIVGNHAATLTAEGRCDEAEPLHLAVIDGLRRTLPADAVRVPEQQRSLGLCLLERGQFAEAETLLLSSYEALRARGEDDPLARESATALLRLFALSGKPERAAEVGLASIR